MTGSATKQSSPRVEPDCFAGARNDEAFSRRVRTRVLLHEKRKAPDPIPSDGAGGGTGSISIAPGSQKNQEGGTPTDAYVQPPRPQPASFPACGGGQRRGRGARPAGRARLSAFHRGACGSEPTPPLSSSTRFLGRGPHQALPEAGLSQSSELLADRSWCRPGVFPEPPGDGSDEPPSAGTALAPAAGVTRRPSYKLSEIRDVRIRNRDKCQAIVAISATAGSCRKAGAPQHRACYRFSRGEKRGVNDRRQGNRHFARRHRQDRDGEDRALF